MPKSKPSSIKPPPTSSPPSSAPSEAPATDEDDGKRADKIVSSCLEMIQDGLGKLPDKLEPRDLVDVANVARAVSAIRARPKPKEERDYDALLDEVKKDPELMAALGLRAAEPSDQRRDEGSDDDDADE